MNCSLPGFSRGIFQARVLEWVAISFSRGSSPPRDWTLVSHIVCRCLTVWATREVLQAYTRGWQITFILPAKFDQLVVVALGALLEKILELYPNSNKKSNDWLVMSAIIVDRGIGGCMPHIFWACWIISANLMIVTSALTHALFPTGWRTQLLSMLTSLEKHYQRGTRG